MVSRATGERVGFAPALEHHARLALCRVASVAGVQIQLGPRHIWKAVSIPFQKTLLFLLPPTALAAACQVCARRAHNLSSQHGDLSSLKAV